MTTPAGLDWDWATRTGGALSARQRRQLLTPLLRIAVAMPAARVRLALGRRGTAGLDLETLRWPDSALARAAEEEARECLTPHVLHHSYRAYLFALTLAAVDGVAVDEELGYVSCLLHDLTLEHPTPGRCFAVTGGERAHAFALAHGASAERATTIAEAVCGHITVGVADDLADPAGFVSAGANLDVTGARLGETDPAFISAVLARHPRLEFKRHMRAAWAAEGRAVPDGRSRWLTTRAAFPLLIQSAPFSE